MKSNSKYFFSGIILTLVLVFGAIIQFPDQDFHLIICDVGQGDAILAIKNDTQILIDGGPSDQVIKCLSDHLPFWDRTIELVINSHPDSDHLNGLLSVIERYNINQIVSNSIVADTAIFSKFRSQVIEKKIPVFSPKKGDKIKISNLELEFLYPLEKLGAEIVWQKPDDFAVLGTTVYAGNFNETSVAFNISYKDFDALLVGDIGSDQERLISIDPKKIEVLKIAHHGSKYSTSQAFLELVKPLAAVISVGATNNYGHPSPEVIERLKSFQIQIFRTDLDGEIEFVSDGKSWNRR